MLSALLALSFAPALSAQDPSPSSPDARSLVRRAVQHRLDAEKHHQPFRYRFHRTDTHHDITKEIIETRDGDVARLVAINGKPLSAEADRVELTRLDTLASHPAIQQHRHRSEQKDAQRVDSLLVLLPDAFLYHLEGVEPCASGRCYRLSYKPNPKFNPPTLEADVLRGVAGQVWIDSTHERLVRLEGRFIAPVDFGYGILGRIDPGGTFELDQADVGGGNWQPTHLILHVTGKALMVKSLSFHIMEDASHFSPVPPNLNYRDAIRLLKQSAMNGSTANVPEK